jgi:mycothiol synthase
VPCELTRHVEAPLLTALERMFARVEQRDRRPALSDHLLLDLRAGGTAGFIAAICRADGDGEPIAYAQASAANEAAAMEVVVDPDHREHLGDFGAELIAELAAAVAADGGRALDWWIHGDAGLASLAERSRFIEVRRLHEMRRTLPAARSAEVPTRAFVIGRDEAAWVSVNNRAFAGHTEQGGWTVDALRRREREPWFDPQGFRIHERDGRMAAFCWTKVHEPTAYEHRRIGEIYVIAVDPDFHGLGLGSQLTLAGLDHLSGRGVTLATLFVDAANEAAVRLYERLGFERHSLSTAYRLEMEHAPDASHR